ncbi:phosphohistidine phosphatase SixA [Budvicia diplopodorum]|uniref:phosphohistidine phosphatase SixA n=1 Tax=Budvicia diplopodorum TaxID=1119056 RepID=UPI001359C25A|nr:phosphohistidine phosphatase SixA [Budvicia diplopodorum]
MKVLIMRHGEASFHAESDADRNLTERGRVQTAQMAVWLRNKISHIDRILVSPYIRAQQTLNVIKHEFPLSESSEIAVLSELTPGGDSALTIDYLMALAQEGIDSVLIVSHLPLVGYLVADLCPGVYPPMFSTSAVACVVIDAQGIGTLEWQQTASSVD